MQRLLCLSVSLWLLATLAACARRQDNRADVERGIQRYIAAKPGLSSSMSMEVRSVNFGGDQAVAEVIFRSKTNPQASIGMRYVLKRTGKDSWEVEPGKSTSIPMREGKR